MNTSLSWIKAYVPDLNVTEQEYTDAMTLSGTKVEGYELLDADLENIVIGQIEKIERIRMRISSSSARLISEVKTIQIVTGAPNVEEGTKVPVVLDGGRVAGGHEAWTKGGIEIKKGKLRGSGELWHDVFNRRAWLYKGYVSGSTGVWNLYLPDDAEVGENAVEALGTARCSFRV